MTVYNDLTVKSKPESKSKARERSLYLFDCLFANFVVAPLVVSVFRGTWHLVAIHYRRYFPFWGSFILVNVIKTVLTYYRKDLQREVIDKQKKLTSFKSILLREIIIRIYHYVFAVSCITFWVRIWEMVPLYKGPELGPAVIVALTCLGLLILMRSVRNLIAPPIVIVTDQKEFAFDFPTRFRVDGTREPGLYILDCLFSVLVIGSLVVFVWRGLWVLLDLRLFPENHVTSAWASLIIGYIIVAVTFLLQPLMKWACERLDGFKRVLVADIFLFSSFVGTVNVWRGVWQLLDIYFIPENKYLSDWLSHGLSLILLILLNCSNSVLVRGVYIDAEEPDGQCVVFPVYYIRLFFQKERTKKEQRMRDKLDKIEKNNAVLSEKPIIMNHSSSPVTQNAIPMANKFDPEEVPIAKQNDDNLPEIHYANDVSKNNNNNNNEPTDSSTTKM